LSSIIRSISLDEQTAVIAKSVPNFSRFVRECLLRYHAVEHEAGCPVESLGGALKNGFCTPGRGRFCLKHWPSGLPDLEDWKKFQDMMKCNPKRLYESYPECNLSSLELLSHGSKDERIQAWIQRQAERRNPAQINFAGMIVEGNAKYQKKVKTESKRRFRDFLRRKNR